MLHEDENGSSQALPKFILAHFIFLRPKSKHVNYHIMSLFFRPGSGFYISIAWTINLFKGLFLIKCKKNIV